MPTFRLEVRNSMKSGFNKWHTTRSRCDVWIPDCSTCLLTFSDGSRSQGGLKLNLKDQMLNEHRLCPDNLVGLNVFSMCSNRNASENKDGVHGTIVEAVVDNLDDPSNVNLSRFRVKIGDEIVDKTYEDLRNNITWPIKDIIDHVGPLEPEDDGFKGSLYNVKVAWGRCGASCFDPTWESLQNIANGDPASCLRYAKRKGLLNTPGWDFLKGNEYGKNGENNSSYVQTDFTVEHEKNSIADDDSSNDNDSEEDQNDNEWDGDIAVAVSQESAAMPFGLENDQREGEIETVSEIIDLLED